MDIFNENQLGKKRKKSEFLEENFEDPEDADILIEKQVKEREEIVTPHHASRRSPNQHHKNRGLHP